MKKINSAEHSGINIFFRFQIIVGLLTFVILSGCTPATLNYRLDPDVGDLQSLAGQAKQIAFMVVDKRTDQTQASTDSLIFVAGPDNEAAALKRKIIDSLMKNNFKIISNPLLADLSIELTIEQLNAQVEKSMFKSNVKVTSHLRVKAKKQENSFERLYKSNRSQEVANPANETDVTGVVNQLLSQQLGQIFADPELVKLANN